MLPQCRELVNLVERAREINKPITSYTQHWKSRPVWRGNNACTNTAGLVEGLEKVVNEQQIIRSSYDIFPRKHGCIVRDVIDIVATRLMGLYLSHENDDAGRKFWFEVHQVIYKDASGNLTYAMLPVNPARASFLELSEQCASNTVDISGMKLYGATIDDVPGTEVQVGSGSEQIPDQSQVPVGRDDCHIGNTFKRR